MKENSNQIFYNISNIHFPSKNSHAKKQENITHTLRRKADKKKLSGRVTTFGKKKKGFTVAIINMFIKLKNPWF